MEDFEATGNGAEGDQRRVRQWLTALNTSTDTTKWQLHGIRIEIQNVLQKADLDHLKLVTN